jgi:hypothetical protein
MGLCYIKVEIADLTKARLREVFEEHMERKDFVSFSRCSVKGKPCLIFGYNPIR